MSQQPVTGACAFVYRDPARVVFDQEANPLLTVAVSDLDLTSYCVEESKPVSTVLAFSECEMLVIAVAHRQHTVIVAWHTPLFMDLLAVIQGQRYDSPDSLRNNVATAIPIFNPKLPSRQLHLYANYPYVPLVRSFGYDGLRMLLSLASSNRTVIFIGDSLSAPSLCCFGLRAALQPLEWLGLFAPVCDPFSIAAAIFNEVAIIGTHSSAVPSLLLSNKRDTFIANCGTGAIAPAWGSTVVYTFPPSEKLKTALGDGSDLAEGIYNYWATHCMGQYRKGLSGRSFDPFKCLFPTTAGSSRERLARNLSSSPSFSRWLTAIVHDEKKASFTDYCARQFPDLFPDYHKGKGASSVLSLGLFAKAKQTIRSMTTDVDVRLSQYMTSPEYFGGYIHSAADTSPLFAADGGGTRLPLDCLINFVAYHALLAPKPYRPDGGASETRADAGGAGDAPKSSSPARRTGMSMIKDGPPKEFNIVNAPAADPPSTPPPRSITPTPVTEPQRAPAVSSPPPQPAAAAPATSPVPAQPTATAESSAISQGPPPPSSVNAGKYDAFAELEKLQVKPATPPPAEPQPVFKTLEDFFQ